MARSRSICCSENSTLCYMCVAEVRVTDCNVTTLTVKTKILLWQVYVLGNNRMYLGLRVKCFMFFSGLF